MKVKSIIFWVGAVLAGILIFLTGGQSKKAKIVKIKARVARRKNNIISFSEQIKESKSKIASGVEDKMKEHIKIVKIDEKRNNLKEKLISDVKEAESLSDDQIASDVGAFLSGGF